MIFGILKNMGMNTTMTLSKAKKAKADFDLHRKAKHARQKSQKLGLFDSGKFILQKA